MIGIMNIPEVELIRRCVQKDAKAQKLLYDTYHSTLLGICMRYAKNKTEAKDILQMGMIRIFKHIGSFAGKGSFEGWMKRIVINVSIDNFRKSNKFYYHHNFDELNGERYLTTEIPDNLELKDILNTVQQLPPGYRIVFNLYAIEGYSHKEIGDQLGISENTSKSQLLKARRSLIERLAKLNTLPRLKYAQNE